MFKQAFLVSLLLLLSGCGLLGFEEMATPTPLITPVVQPISPHIVLTADHDTVQIGGIITVQARTVNLGMPQYTFTLNPGVTITIPYSTSATPTSSSTQANAPFQIISTEQDLADSLIRLEAVHLGSATLSAAASGESVSAEGAFYWSSGGSNVLTLTVSR